ncbi:MAG TPA: hypothetical protein VFA03_00295 [Acetobacteraceae bacterium]|nr:hypothetical protein [Acetobacteraceae bacterium]
MVAHETIKMKRDAVLLMPKIGIEVPLAELYEALTLSDEAETETKPGGDA